MENLTIIKNYMGEYFSKVPGFVVNTLKTTNCTEKDYLILTNQEYIKSILTYLLVKNGKLDYKVFLSYDFISIYLGQSEEYDSIYNLVEIPFLVVLHYFNIENKRTEEFVTEILSQRSFLKKRSLLFSANDHFPSLKNYQRIRLFKSSSDIV